MPSLITLQDIDETLDNLELKQGTLKAELATVIRSYFVDDQSVQAITSIPTDEIVLKIWGPCQAEELKAKKKNFSSLKSALNKSLKDLDKAGKNQAGIILGRDNVFIVSEERKDDLLKQMGLSPNSPHLLHDMFAAFKKFFSENIKDQNTQEVKDLLAEFEEAQQELRKMAGLEPEAVPGKSTAETAGTVESGTPSAGETAHDEPAETIELLEGDELEVIEESDAIEVLDEEEMEILEADELEEVLAEEVLPGEGPGTAEGGPAEGQFPDGVEPLDQEALEEGTDEDLGGAELLAEEMEILEADELEEVLEEEALPGEGPGTEEGGPAKGQLPDGVERLGQETSEEDAGEGLGGAELLAEEVEILEASELEEVLEEEALPGEGPGTAGPAEGQFPDGVELLGQEALEEGTDEDLGEAELLAEEVEILEASELEEVLEEEALPGEGPGTEEGGPAKGQLPDEVERLGQETSEEDAGEGLGGAELLAEEVEILEASELEEVLEEEALPGEGPGTAGPAEGQFPDGVERLGQETLEEGTDEDLGEAELLAEEVELLEADELEEVLEEEALPGEGPGTEEGGPAEEHFAEEFEASPESMGEKNHQPTSLEVLSKYIEAEEAVNQSKLLRETQEEFIHQILDRFMPKFIKIPASLYLVGSATPTGLEQPLHKVLLHDFYLGQAPVTNDLFDMFVRETGYTTDAEEAGYGIVFEGRCINRKDPETGREILSLNQGTVARHVSGANWRHPAGPGSSLEGKHDHPVVQVSHSDAMAFAAWAGKRLPTEEEWEAAARGASGRLYPWGDMWLADFGNFEATCLGGTTSVEHFGRKAMSPFGIHDLLGNAAEWTSSVHAGQTDLPPGRSAEKIYILKGGSWITGGIVSAAWRQIEREKYWANTIGFRCAV